MSDYEKIFLTGAGTGVNENNPYYAARAGFQNQLNQRNLNQNYQNYGAAYGPSTQFGQGRQIQGQPGQMGPNSVPNVSQMGPGGNGMSQNGQIASQFAQYRNQAGMSAGNQQQANVQQNSYQNQAMLQSQQTSATNNQQNLLNQGMNPPAPPQK